MQHEARQKLNEMLTRTGHALAVEDFDDIAELDRLAAAVVDPETGVDSPLTNHAVFFRGVPVFPLTLAHLTFLDEASDLLKLDGDERTLCMLWVCTLPQITDNLYDGNNSRKLFRRWARRCKWRITDIEAILDLRYRRIAQNVDENVTEANRDGALIGMLTREYGESPNYWMYDAALGVIESCVTDWNRQQEAQAAAYRRASGGKGPAVAPAPSPKFRAMRKFRECAERIEAKWQH